MIRKLEDLPPHLRAQAEKQLGMAKDAPKKKGRRTVSQILVDQAKKKPKRNKYGAIKTKVDGIIFDSKREAKRYTVLKRMEADGDISNLTLQVPYQITINGVKVCKYVSDFEYVRNGEKVVEDCKGMRTAVYRLKKKLMKAVHGIEIEES